MEIDREELVRLTGEYGGEWGLNHVRRLLHLIDCIGVGQEYDADALWVAAYLHDWGGYAQWAQDGVDHAARSAIVAEAFLTERGYPAGFIALVTECIAYHHAPDPGRSIEAILLCDADALDFLGAVGVLRIFSKQTKNLRGAYEVAKKRRSSLPEGLVLAAAKEAAVPRLAQMDTLLAAFEQ
ncbi:MAG: HD domain-containing protein [Anaerolineae bacterium]|nr:HD domain-containing protein [Anaerolineae bacterium]